MSWIYVVGEHRDRGPVKIGMTEGALSSTGRAGLSGGNARDLVLLDALEVPLAELRWTEWRVHRALEPWHRRGEWYAVRPLLDDWVAWKRLLRAAKAGRVEGGSEVEVGTRGHRLKVIERVGATRPLKFRARCSCGSVLRGTEGQAFLTVLRLFCSHAGAQVPAGVGSSRRGVTDG